MINKKLYENLTHEEMKDLVSLLRQNIHKKDEELSEIFSSKDAEKLKEYFTKNTFNIPSNLIDEEKIFCDLEAKDVPYLRVLSQCSQFENMVSNLCSAQTNYIFNNPDLLDFFYQEIGHISRKYFIDMGNYFYKDTIVEKAVSKIFEHNIIDLSKPSQLHSFKKENYTEPLLHYALKNDLISLTQDEIYHFYLTHIFEYSIKTLTLFIELHPTINTQSFSKILYDQTHFKNDSESENEFRDNNTYYKSIIEFLQLPTDQFLFFLNTHTPNIENIQDIMMMSFKKLVKYEEKLVALFQYVKEYQPDILKEMLLPQFLEPFKAQNVDITFLFKLQLDYSLDNSNKVISKMKI